MTRTFLASFGILALLAPSASAQAVAFQPGVASFPNGVSMSVTPVVSADRRYVRLGVSPYFTGLQGFDTFPVPAAVGGGGFGGLGGGVGFAGMDGPIDGMTAYRATARWLRLAQPDRRRAQGFHAASVATAEDDGSASRVDPEEKSHRRGSPRGGRVRSGGPN